MAKVNKCKLTISSAVDHSLHGEGVIYELLPTPDMVMVKFAKDRLPSDDAYSIGYELNVSDLQAI